MRKTKRVNLQIWAVIVWIATTLSLVLWWLIYSLQQLDKLENLVSGEAQDLARQQSMLLQEGVFLFGLLLLGASGLLYFILREKRRNQELKQFFAAFTHEVKTSLASLRLQAESLQEDLKGQEETARLTRRMLKDTVRLELQLENLLFLSREGEGNLFIERISLKNLLNTISLQWPEIQIHIHEDAQLLCDRRLLEVIFKNLVQNAVVHGQAKNLDVKVEKGSERHLVIALEDDGVGFQGNSKRLGQIFIRHTTTSGTGIGLYLVKNLAELQGGRAEFQVTGRSGFRVELQLPAERGA